MCATPSVTVGTLHCDLISGYACNTRVECSSSQPTHTAIGMHWSSMNPLHKLQGTALP